MQTLVVVLFVRSRVEDQQTSREEREALTRSFPALVIDLQVAPTATARNRRSLLLRSSSISTIKVAKVLVRAETWRHRFAGQTQ